MKYLMSLTLILFTATITLAQEPLKLMRPINPKKQKMCIVPGKKFEIRNADDQAVCDDLKKPSRKGNLKPQNPPIGSPNPITLPPTGN